MVEPLPVRDLEVIATENAVQGCVRETWAALEATHQATHARVADLRATMVRIATDETRHAELAQQIDVWCRSQLGGAAQARIDAARLRAIGHLGVTVGNVSPQLAAMTGLPTGRSARRLFGQLRASLW